jgi:DNA polymerase delta subunit 2
MLEDESGRLQLTGRFLPQYSLCTGAIVAVLGTENSDGAFEVIEVKLADLPAQPVRWALSDSISGVENSNGNGVHDRTSGKIAIVSGLEIDGVSSDTLILDLLAEYLTGEAGDDQEVSKISRLVLAGNSFSDSSPIPTRQDSENIKRKNVKKFGTDPMAYNASPALQLDQFLSAILPSIPVTLLPGGKDPANVSVPQQPLHAAYFPQSRQYIKAQLDTSTIPSWFDSVSNPWEGEVDGWRVLATGGQPLNDMFKYVDGDDRLGMMECFLRWRNVAPTAPDTLCMISFLFRLLLAKTSQGPTHSKIKIRL